nr:MAG TPA: hypothetical protein [Caudoviricetes sp.]
MIQFFQVSYGFVMQYYDTKIYHNKIEIFY